MNIKDKLIDWKNRLKMGHMLSIITVMFAIIIGLGIFTYKKQMEYRQASENEYNMAFFELVDYVQNIETYLAKSLISTTPEHGAETLTHLWREADLAQSYLAQIPIGIEEISNTAKFLNQVSDYSYSLSRKNIYNEGLSQEDLANLKLLHDYSIELNNTLVQLSADMNEGRISWGELTKQGNIAFAQQVSNISQDSFSNLEENFHEYAGLIYDGAFSEHLTNPERKGLTGEDIDENKAKEIATEFIGQDKIEEINLTGFSENGNIPSYDFSVKLKGADKNNNQIIAVSKKGGHIVFSNYNRDVKAKTLSPEQADEKGKEYLKEKGYSNVVETYYLEEQGIITVNYAYEQDGVVVYPDLIKLKIALDDGEILGIETTGYLNSHTTRDISNVKITKEEAKKTINKDLELSSEKLAIIPTEYQTELLCWEFKGKIDDTEFLVKFDRQ